MAPSTLLKWTRDNQKMMVDAMLFFFHECNVERAQWDYNVRQSCRNFKRCCRGAVCDAGIGLGVTIVWVVVFLPRGVSRASSNALRWFVGVLEMEQVAFLWVGALRFLMRWLSLVVLGAVGGVFVQAFLVVLLHVLRIL